jgi:hypothetical protein
VKSNLVRRATGCCRAVKKLALAGAAAAVLSNPARAQSPEMGVNFTNAERLSVAARDTALDQMKAAGVKAIRTPLAQQWSAGSFQPSVDVVKAAWARGIKSLLVISLTAPKYFPAGAAKRSADPAVPSIWAAYRLQDVDPDLFTATVAPLLQQLDDAGVQLAGVELFNEIGNPAFNGDIAINGPRGGYLIGFEDLLDPAYADVARGYRNYIRVLAALKEIRDGLTVNKLTPIISAGLNTPSDAPEGTKLNVTEDEVSLKGVLTFLRANGLDDHVDQYGVHSYILWARNSASNIHHLNSALIMEPYTKPVAVTEWGMQVAAGCPANDAARQTQFNLLRAEMASYGEEVASLYAFDWNGSSYGICLCGALTGSGSIALSP